MFSIPDKKFWKNFDWFFALSILMLLAVGFLNMYSASRAAG